MNIYIFLFCYFSFISFFDFSNSEKLKTAFFYLSCILLVFFGGLRFDTGWDYPGYKYYYDKIPSLIDLISNYDEFSAVYFEPGFKLLMSTLKFLNIEFQGFIFIVNFITTAFFFLFIRKVGNVVGYKNIMLLLYFSTVFLYTNFSVLRQGIAIGLWLFSISYLNRNLFKYIGLVLLGSSFHYSLLLFLILPILIKCKPKQSLLIFIMAISIIIYVLSIKWLETISPLFPDFIYSKLNHYWSSDRFGSMRELGFGFVEKLIIMILILFFYFYKLKDKRIKETFYPYVIIYLLYFVCYMLFFEANIIYDRTRLYFASFSICIFPFLFMFFTRESRLCFYFLVIFYSFFMFNKILSSEQNKIVFIPYHSILSDKFAIPEYQKGDLRINLGQELDNSKL